LPADGVAGALASGAEAALAMLEANLIFGALLRCQGQIRAIGGAITLSTDQPRSRP
jgi:hypothetical protein